MRFRTGPLMICAMVAAGFALTILVFYPGYMTNDATFVYQYTKERAYGDWQSPVMTLLWRLIDPIAPGSASMFLLIAALYWLGFAVVALALVRRSRGLGLLMPLLDSLAPIRARRGRPRRRPVKLHADKAYDQPALRREVRRRGIIVRIARKGIESSQRLGRHRWIVEACLAWLQRNRRLVRRYDRKPEHFQAFADLGCTPLCYRRLVVLC